MCKQPDVAHAVTYLTEPLTSKFNGSSVTPSQASRVGHLTAVDTNVRF